ncbi:hypothetical protein L195_g044533, partial [Trifolium pratense]
RSFDLVSLSFWYCFVHGGGSGGVSYCSLRTVHSYGFGGCLVHPCSVSGGGDGFGGCLVHPCSVSGADVGFDTVYGSDCDGTELEVLRGCGGEDSSFESLRVSKSAEICRFLCMWSTFFRIGVDCELET